MKKGLIHAYFGDGKGKTTAAVGLALRALGSHMRVLFVQFLKGGLPSGEIDLLTKLPNITLLRGMTLNQFSWTMTPEEKKQVRVKHDALLKEVALQIQKNDYHLLVLDEALGASHLELLSKELLLDLLQHKPEALEVVLTGRDPSPELLALADYATEMRKIKHPFDNGISGRKGIEF